MLKMDMEYRYGILFVRLTGSLNKNTSYKLTDTLVPLIVSQGIKNLVYNFDELLTIDDIGGKSLLMGYNAVVNNNGNVLVVNNRFNLTYLKEIENELTALKLLKV